MSFAVAALLIITPFYYELTYQFAFIFCWWHWYTRIFFFKFISSYLLLFIFSYLLQLSIRWFNWQKLFCLMVLITLCLLYLLYTIFIISFFGFFTDPLWYQKNRHVDYIQMSHEPWKWGWGDERRDHFTYHNVSTVFWFKSDGPFASVFLLSHLLLFLILFFTVFYWLILLRKTYVLKEISYSFTIFTIYTLKQFFYFFLLLFGSIIATFIINYCRLPIELWWSCTVDSWILICFYVFIDYFETLFPAI